MQRIAAIGFAVFVGAMVVLALTSRRSPEPGPAAVPPASGVRDAPGAPEPRQAATPSATAPSVTRPAEATAGAREGDAREGPADPRSDALARAAAGAPQTAAAPPRDDRPRTTTLRETPRDAPVQDVPRIGKSPAPSPDDAAPTGATTPPAGAPGAPGGSPPAPAAGSGDLPRDRALAEALARRSLGEGATEREIRDRADLADTLLSTLGEETRRRVEERLAGD